MNKSAKHLLIATSLLAGVIATGESSRAATITVPAKASPNAHARGNNCWGWGYTYMRNDCSTTQSLYVPIVMPYSNQNMVYFFSGHGASPSNNVGCLARSVSLHGSGQGATARKYLSLFGVSQLVEIGFLWVPFQATSSVECEVSPGGRVNTAVVNF